jgi:hypothetical protein
VTPRRTIDGVFGIARNTACGTSSSIDATVTPAATLTTSASGSRASAISRSRSAIIAGLTPSSTRRAPSSAMRLASGLVSAASEVTRPERSGAAFASLRFVTVMPSLVAPLSSRPDRIAPPIDPAPRMAMRGK